MENFRHNNVNITGFRLFDPETERNKQVLKEMRFYQIQTDLTLLNTTGSLSVCNKIPPCQHVVHYIHRCHLTSEGCSSMFIHVISHKAMFVDIINQGMLSEA